MNFEVNGIPYLLTFDANAAQWCLLTPSRHGVEELEIHDDGGLLTSAVPASGKGKRQTIN
jgi:hypothetical protein